MKQINRPRRRARTRDRVAVAQTAIAQTKWDLPTAYPATNFHTENIMQFVADVERASGGKLKIQVHPNAALFKAPEIKRAVQGGQAQAGEILLVNYENEDPLYGLDGIPFLATSYGEVAEALQGVAQGARRQARQAGDEAPVHGAVAAAGHLHQEDAGIRSPT